ncbi:hypothetical protein [Streptomyces bluensis]|uniref:hypothetical protein n=1 Tax=Streptomyces bluensis TaxID=33897 RepID=UPI00167B0C0F|nr:hypothetical protein [Streptomyces bluensis]GGZ75672.1 hypothetical protein GCM10010344_48150 [Streptomyces bluensis]
MSKRKVTRGATGAVVTVLALGALQGASAAGDDSESKERAASSASPAAPSKVCVGTQPEGRLPSWGPKGSYPDDTPLYRVLAYIDKTTKAKAKGNGNGNGNAYRDSFTGWSVDDANQAANVYRIPGKDADQLDADLCGAAEQGVTIRLYDTDVTEGELKKLHGRISGDMGRWKGTFMIWTVGMTSHSVNVGVSDPEKAEPILREAYGEEAMRHVTIERSEQPTILLPGK